MEAELAILRDLRGLASALESGRPGFKSQSPTYKLIDLEQVPLALQTSLCIMGIVISGTHPTELLRELNEIKCVGNQSLAHSKFSVNGCYYSHRTTFLIDVMSVYFPVQDAHSENVTSFGEQDVRRVT